MTLRGLGKLTVSEKENPSEGSQAATRQKPELGRQTWGNQNSRLSQLSDLTTTHVSGPRPEADQSSSPVRTWPSTEICPTCRHGGWRGGEGGMNGESSTETYILPYVK